MFLSSKAEQASSFTAVAGNPYKCGLMSQLLGKQLLVLNFFCFSVQEEIDYGRWSVWLARKGEYLRTFFYSRVSARPQYLTGKLIGALRH